jgi:hypothetical protein
LTPRLPQPGSDQGTWGDILNEYLSQSHKADGTLKDNIVTPASIAPAAVDGTALASSSISEDKLDTAVQAKLNASLIPIADATTSSKGLLQLAGDLGGTASAPTVPGLSSKTNIGHTHTIDAVANLQTALDAKADQTTTYSKTEVDTALAGKAAASHTHAIADVTNLQSNLDLKADQLTTYTKSEVDTALAAKPDSTNTYTKTEVDTALSSKAPVVHTHKQTFPYSQAGTLALKTGTFRLYNDSDASWTIVGVRATVGSAPTGASIIIDVNVNGTTIFTTQGNRPSIASTEFTSGFVSSVDSTSVPVGAYITVDIDQVGSTLPGSDLGVQVMVN